MEKKRIQSFFTKASSFYQVALYQWLYQNLEAVASMYEDRFDLWTFESQLIEKVDNSWNGNYSWWKRLVHKKSDTVSSKLDHVLINNFCMPVKRTKELRALTGWYDLLPNQNFSSFHSFHITLLSLSPVNKDVNQIILIHTPSMRELLSWLAFIGQDIGGC